MKQVCWERSNHCCLAGERGVLGNVASWRKSTDGCHTEGEIFPLDGIHIISISDLGLDSDGATRLETADGSGLRSGSLNTCIRELQSGRMAWQCALGLHRVALDSATRLVKSVAKRKIV